MAMLIKAVLLMSMALPSASQTTTQEGLEQHAQAAQEAEQKGDFAVAVKNYEYLVRAMPKSAELQSNLGMALYLDQQLERAVAVFQKAIALNPRLLTPHVFAGIANQRLSKPDAAVAQLRYAVQIKPDDPLSRLWLGYAYIAQSKYEESIPHLEKVVQLDANNVDAWYALGEAYLQIGNQATMQLLKVAPDGGRVWQLAGEQKEAQNDSAGAREDYTKALERRPELQELRAKASAGSEGKPASTADRAEEDRLYHAAHHAEEKSRAAFHRIVEIAPDSYRAHQVMAEVLLAQNKPAEAIQELRTVLQMKPDLPGVHEEIGNTHLQSGEMAEALKEYEEELRLQPRSAQANLNAGRVYLTLGNLEAAETTITKALQLDRPPSETYFLLGKLRLRQNNYKGSIEALNRYVVAAPEDADAYFLLMRAYRGAGDRENAEKALAQYQKTSRELKTHHLAQQQFEALNRRGRSTDRASENREQ